jgi:hypothetical protein
VKLDIIFDKSCILTVIKINFSMKKVVGWI